MKKRVAELVSKCLTSQRIKAEPGKPKGLLLPMEILNRKWEHIDRLHR